MKILVLGSRIPYPLTDGGAIATYQTLKIYTELNNQVTYFSYNTKKHYLSSAEIKKHFNFCNVIDNYLDASIKPLSAFWHLLTNKNYNISRFNSAITNKQLALHLQQNQYDIVHFESLYTTSFLPIVKKHHTGPILLRQHNIEFQIWEKLATASSGIKKWYLNKLSKQLKKYELQTLKLFDTIINISWQDTNYLKSIGINSQTIGMAIPIDKPAEKLVNNCLFHIGNMQWQPNYQGVIWFVHKVWPIVLKKQPQAQLHIAGLGLHQNDKNFTAPSVINHGTVTNAKQFMLKHGAMIIPLQSASGLRVKAIEAMAQGICTIGTSIGFSGLQIQNKEHCLIATTEQEFADLCIHTLQNPKNAIEIGKNAYKWVQQHCSQKAINSQWEAMLHTCVNQ